MKISETKYPTQCSVEDGRKTKPERFAIVAPYNDGLPGTAVLGSFAYRPHAEFFATAPELYALCIRAETMLGMLANVPAAQRLVADMQDALAKARGEAA